NLFLVCRIPAQTFTTLHSFSGGSDGANPGAGLVINLSGSTLYGMAWPYGGPDAGTVFAINTNGTGFTTLHHFAAPNRNSSGFYTNSDGADPVAGLILSGGTLYGTAPDGGSSGGGTVFAVSTDGAGFTTLHHFTEPNTDASGYYTNSDGATPYAG